MEQLTRHKSAILGGQKMNTFSDISRLSGSAQRHAGADLPARREGMPPAGLLEAVDQDWIGGLEVEQPVGHAAAVEEQTATTNEISRNISEAAREAGVTIGVLVDVNVGQDRCGVAPGNDSVAIEPAENVARRSASGPGVNCA